MPVYGYQIIELSILGNVGRWIKGKSALPVYGYQIIELSFLGNVCNWINGYSVWPMTVSLFVYAY